MALTDLPTQNDPVDIATRLGLACLLGMVIGLDRELRGKEAGLRTHMLISLGAALTTVVGFELYRASNTMSEQSEADLLRVIEGVVGAIGFLGAGAIISRDQRIRNMTSAANIWVCGAIGMACGAGFYLVATIALAFAMAILTILGLVEKWLQRDLE